MYSNIYNINITIFYFQLELPLLCLFTPFHTVCWEHFGTQKRKECVESPLKPLWHKNSSAIEESIELLFYFQEEQLITRQLYRMGFEALTLTINDL